MQPIWPRIGRRDGPDRGDCAASVATARMTVEAVVLGRATVGLAEGASAGHLRVQVQALAAQKLVVAGFFGGGVMTA